MLVALMLSALKKNIIMTAFFGQKKVVLFMKPGLFSVPVILFGKELQIMPTAGAENHWIVLV